jgi:hypothetical protein
MNESIRKYMASIGRLGGRVSKRKLSPDEARNMVRVREAGRAYRKYYAQCFWSSAPDYKVGIRDLPWVAEQLKKHGGREAWELGARLCP